MKKRIFMPLCVFAIFLFILSVCDAITDYPYEYEVMETCDATIDEQCDSVPENTEDTPIVFTCTYEYLRHAIAYGRNPSRGVWNGNVYTNEYLGLWFYKPCTWIVTPPGVLGRMSQLRDGRQMPDEGVLITDALLDALSFIDLIDMDVNNYYTGASVSISFTHFHYPEVPQFASPNRSLSPPRTELAELINTPGTIRIGAYYWHLTSRYEWGAQRDFVSGNYVNTYRYQFVNVEGLFAKVIVIFVNCYSETIDDILLMFGDINTTPISAPVPVLPERIPWLRSLWPAFEPPFIGHPIIGTWVRDENAGYYYVFEYSGWGYSSSRYYDFLWIVEDDQLKIFSFYMHEVRNIYIFTIEDNILTLKGASSYEIYKRQPSSIILPIPSPQPPNHPIIGQWVDYNYMEEITIFNADGTGSRVLFQRFVMSTICKEPFIWAVENDRLTTIGNFAINEITIFEIDGNILTLYDEPYTGMYTRFIRFSD